MANDLIADYLYNRSQCVEIDGELSTALQITIGVPQGSVLSPLLFIFYVNVLFRVLPSFVTITLANSTFTFSLMSAYSYRKFPAE